MSRSLAHAIVAAAFVGLLALACLQVPGDWNWSGVWAYRQKFVQGWLVTLGLSVAALVLSVLIGLVVALLLAARNPLVEATGRIYVELIRGTPLLVQLLLVIQLTLTLLLMRIPMLGIVGLKSPTLCKNNKVT